MADEPRDRLLREEAAIDLYWNALADGRLATPDPALDPVLARTIRRVHALAGQPVPEPDQADRLWRELMSGDTFTAPLRLAPALPRQMNGHGPIALPPQPRRAPVRSHPHAKRVASGLSFVATLALVAAMLAMIFFVYQDGRNHANLPPLQTTPTAVASPSTSWPTMLGNNRRTASTADAGPVGSFATLWTFKAPAGLNNPIVAGDAVFLQSEDGTLYCLDRMTGHERWALDTGGIAGGNTMSYPAVAGDTVYASSRTGDVMAVDIATGSVKWRVHLGDAPIEASILVQDGVVYTGDANGLFVALNGGDGSTRWQFNDGQGFGNTFPAFDKGVIFVGGQQSVRAIGAADGKLVWEAKTDGQVRGAAVDGGGVYAPTGAGSVVALAASDGHQLWSRPFPNVGPALSVAVADGTVVAGFDAGGMAGIDAETGKVIWQTPDSGGVTTASKVSIANGIAYAYFGPRGGILALDVSTGQERGFAPTAEIRMPPSIVNGVLYAGSSAGRTAYAFVTEGSAATPVNVIATPATIATAAPTPTAVAFATQAAGDSGAQLVWEMKSPHDYGIQVDPLGRLWVSYSPENAVDVFDLDGNRVLRIDSAGNGPGQLTFSCPNAFGGFIGFDPSGNAFITNCGGRIESFAPDGSFRFEIAVKDDTGQSATVLGIAAGSDGRIYAGSPSCGCIFVFDAAGKLLSQFGTAGRGPGTLSHQGFFLQAAPDGNLWVNGGDGFFDVYSPDGTYLRTIGGTDPSVFIDAQGYAIDGQGNLWVADSTHYQIRAFDPNGTRIYAFGSPGSGDLQFLHPLGVTVRGSSVFVFDDALGVLRKYKVTLPPTAATPTP